MCPSTVIPGFKLGLRGLGGILELPVCGCCSCSWLMVRPSFFLKEDFWHRKHFKIFRLEHVHLCVLFVHVLLRLLVSFINNGVDQENKRFVSIKSLT
jgi:hypothetical protein